jgi:hypothetical protein
LNNFTIFFGKFNRVQQYNANGGKKTEKYVLNKIECQLSGGDSKNLEFLCPYNPIKMGEKKELDLPALQRFGKDARCSSESMLSSLVCWTVC